MVMLRRLTLNVFSGWFRLHRWFPANTMKSIRDEIARGERHHAGEICFAVESRFSFWSVLMGLNPHVRTREIFSSMRVWDTQDNSGVLIYLQLAERHIEILADRGIASRVPSETWQQICEQTIMELRQLQPEVAVLHCIEGIHILLAQYFPADENNPKEISDEPVIL
jgi:TPM domain